MAVPRTDQDECSICGDAMPVVSFVKDNGDVQLSLPNENGSTLSASALAAMTAVRLPCGHAYHVTCATRTLMTRATCPTCGGPQETPAPVTHVSIINWDDDDSYIGSDTEMFRQLNIVRSLDATVKRVRSNVKAVRAEYNKVRERLRKERRRTIANALRTLRQQEQATWRASHRHMARALRVEQDVEQAAMRRHFGVAAARLPHRLNLPDAIYAANEGAMEPTRRSFWVG